MTNRLKQKWFTGVPRYIGVWGTTIVYTPRTWTSWGEFACNNISLGKKPTPWEELLTTFVAKQIEHEGTLFGLPSIPEGFCKFPERSYASMGVSNLERYIAGKAVEEYFACIRINAEQWLRQKIKDEGITVLRSLLDET